MYIDNSKVSKFGDFDCYSIFYFAGELHEENWCYLTLKEIYDPLLEFSC